MRSVTKEKLVALRMPTALIEALHRQSKIEKTTLSALVRHYCEIGMADKSSFVRVAGGVVLCANCAREKGVVW